MCQVGHVAIPNAVGEAVIDETALQSHLKNKVFVLQLSTSAMWSLVNAGGFV